MPFAANSLNPQQALDYFLTKVTQICTFFAKKLEMLLPFFQSELLEAGIDEAGRGCLAGPVVAAALIWPSGLQISGLNDSKQLSTEERERLNIEIRASGCVFAIGMATVQEIDEINILQATFLAMHRAVAALTQTPGLLLIDGNRFVPYPQLKHRCEVKGDGRFLSIAAASILAKTHRDEYMKQLHEAYPDYHWNQNKGYPTKKHRCAIAEHGATVHHRRSFRLLAENE